MTVPFASGVTTCTTSWAVPEAPVARAPRFQVTTPPAGAPGADAETNAVFAGTVSLMTTFVASAVPVLKYDRVYVRLAPAPTGSGASVFEMARIGAEVTVTLASGPVWASDWLLTIVQPVLVITVPFASGELT